MYPHEDDKFNIPDYIKQMSIADIRKERNRILMELGKEPMIENLDRYFYTVELNDDDDKIIHLLGNVYYNDGMSDADDCYRIAEWSSVYFILKGIKTLFDQDMFYEYINERINYLGNLTEKEAYNTCCTYFSGNSGYKLHIKDVTKDTPCGNYWFE